MRRRRFESYRGRHGSRIICTEPLAKECLLLQRPRHHDTADDVYLNLARASPYRFINISFSHDAASYSRRKEMFIINKQIIFIMKHYGESIAY